MSKTLETNDTFNNWRTKINNLITGTVAGSFDYDENSTTGLDFVVTEGRIRTGSESVNISGDTVTIPASQTSIVVLYTDPNQTEFRVYEQGSVPQSFVIPLFEIVTNTSTITSITDLRTWADLSGSANDTDSGILTFSQLIEFDKVIPNGKNALSIDPTVDTGVTVTVNPDSTWVIL